MIKQGYDKLNIVNADGEGRVFKLDAYGWLDDFEILSEEDDEEIDIDSIEELEIYEEKVSKGNIIDKINELVEAIKQLNREVKNNANNK